MFDKIEIKDRYKSTLDNEIKNKFLVPVISNAIKYNRAVGFFSSSMLLYIIDGLEDFFQNGGVMNIITSPELSEDDVKAIINGYRDKSEVIEEALLSKFEYESSKSLRFEYLEKLIIANKLNLKIAVMKDIEHYGIFHDKTGILEDEMGNKIAFCGSLNESETAISKNYESIQVFASWRSDYEKNQICSIENDFNNLWNGNNELVDTYDVPEAVMKKILKYSTNKRKEYNEKVEIKKETNIFELRPRIPEFLQKRRSYQDEAICAWKNNSYRGLLNMATGTGKTYTALMGLTDMFYELNESLAIIILCPYIHLVDQWYEDVKLFNYRCFKAYGTIKWRENFQANLKWLNRGMSKHFCCIVTINTFKSSDFQHFLDKINSKIVLVADEAHNLGAKTFKTLLDDRFEYRLGLSATPDRHNDTIGTLQIMDFFEKEVYYFGLEKAIGKYLTEYYYYPVIVYLDEKEYERYYELTKKIQKQMAICGEDEYSQSLKYLLLERSRLIAGANGKIEKLRQLYCEGSDFKDSLVYCGATYVEDDDGIKDKKQIDEITHLLGNEFNIPIAKFTSQESPERRLEIIRDFENRNIDSIVAIKCLDEGVNIPSIRNAYILASSTNPREFIQRRGRVLRQYPGKKYANIYDFVVFPRKKIAIPRNDIGLLNVEFSLIRREIERIYEFSKLSLNPYTSISEIEDIYNEYILLVGGENRYVG